MIIIIILACVGSFVLILGCFFIFRAKRTPDEALLDGADIIPDDNYNIATEQPPMPTQFTEQQPPTQFIQQQPIATEPFVAEAAAEASGESEVELKTTTATTPKQ